ncbi:MAG: maltose ABC transporter permease MalF [Burkholderiaceae bacterium]|nr:maltose ABC transporter permease MalF [Burkholderiaceae bacterium]
MTRTSNSNSSQAGSSNSTSNLLKWPLVATLALAGLYLVFNIYAAGQLWWALGLLVLLGSAFFVYLAKISFAYRYLYPGLAGMAIFVAFPLLYTVQIGFTNYSSSNLLSQERVRSYLLEQTAPDDAHLMSYSLHADGPQYLLALRPLSPMGELGEVAFVSGPLALMNTQTPVRVSMSAPTASTHLAPALPLKEVLKHRDVLMSLVLSLPEGAASHGTDLHYLGVSEFGPLNRLWQANPDGSLTQASDGAIYHPNGETGFFENAATGERLQPGFKVFAGLKHYQRMVMDPDFRGPFFSIFLWTVSFSALTVLFTLLIGMALAVLLNWEALRFRTTYRTLLFLPYAVPGFISILVFKGLFNQNFGEINAILDSLFGIKPAWFADPALARSMLLIVNTWLGYPYIMVLCTGLLKAIPADLYEASAIAGAGPLTNFFKITAPLIAKPLTPLLIGIFAFNFNNFVLIALLTDGRPDYLNTKVPAGQTDILVSYTYRIAFQDSGQDFGLAAAVSTVIFLMVAAMSLINLRLMRANSR